MKKLFAATLIACAASALAAEYPGTYSPTEHKVYGAFVDEITFTVAYPGPTFFQTQGEHYYIGATRYKKGTELEGLIDSYQIQTRGGTAVLDGPFINVTLDPGDYVLVVHGRGIGTNGLGGYLSTIRTPKPPAPKPE
jgi:hypothetical protein